MFFHGGWLWWKHISAQSLDIHSDTFTFIWLRNSCFALAASIPNIIHIVYLGWFGKKPDGCVCSLLDRKGSYQINSRLVLKLS